MTVYRHDGAYGIIMDLRSISHYAEAKENTQ